jgi:AcrR family transcriptional regulator
MRPKRKYELKRRADEMLETRLRITEAAVELHGTLGPSRTTTSAVAKRAGVQRHTVYRHFPTDDALFAACSAHYFAAHPFPDLDAWGAIANPRERLVRGLDEMYAYYERTAPMLSNVLRDLDLVDAVGRTMRPFMQRVEEAAATLAAGWHVRGRRRSVLEAALHHAIDFETWRSLTTGSRITRAEAVELAAALVEAASTPRSQASA